MPAGEQHDVRPTFEAVARNEAEQTVDHVEWYGRPRGQVFWDLFDGFVGEFYHNYINGDIDWWLDHRKKSRGLRYDGGDTPQGWDVKVIKPGHEYVCVNNETAKKYVVYEYDSVAHKIRHMGEFMKEDIGDITLRNGTQARGVKVGQLR